MSGIRPGVESRPFSPSELEGVPGATPGEVAAGARVARELQSLAAYTPVITSPDFADRVMGAIAGEPAPAPLRVAGRALRAGAFGTFLGSIRDAWRVTIGSGFPTAARAQALALVLVVAVLATGSSVATAGALGLLDGVGPALTPPVDQPSPSVPGPSPIPSPSPEASMEPSPSPDGSTSPVPSQSPDETGTPGETDDGGGSGGDRETETPDDHESAEPTDSDDDHETAEPTDSDDDHQTPEPSRTPRPSETPKPDDD